MILPVIGAVLAVALAAHLRSALTPARLLGGALRVHALLSPALLGAGAAAGMATAPAPGNAPEAALDVLDGCELLSATVYHDGEETACHSFACVEQQAQLGRRVLVVYRPVGAPASAQYQMTYNPHRRALDEPPQEHFPPHAREWQTRDDGSAPAAAPGDRILMATLTAHGPHGRSATHDVTDALRRAIGPLGDFHARAGATVTAFSLVPDLPDDIIAASIVYHDDEGTEHAHRLPFAMTDARADEPEWLEPLDAAVPDAPIFPSLPAARAEPLADAPLKPTAASVSRDPVIVNALVATRRAAAVGCAKKKKKCEVQ